MDGGCVGCSWRKSFHSHYVAEIPLSLRSKGVFYYSIPVQDFLHEHPRVIGLEPPDKVPEGLKAPEKQPEKPKRHRRILKH